MTREISDIIAAYKEAHQQGRQTALATVVHVEGSSYRRPGARMLVEDNGRMTGAISGGCLEGDALRKALLAINQMQNKVVTYNTLDEDDVTFGVQLGCNGIVHILFEPIHPDQPRNAIALLEKCLQQRKHAVVATLFSLKNSYAQQPGTCFFFDGETTIESIADQHLLAAVKADAAGVLENKTPLLKQYSENELQGFVELVDPPVSLVIVGAGNDAFPLVEMAAVLGWHITVVDGRSTHANRQRFSKAHQVVVAKPEEAMKQLVVDERTAVVLMTHNYNYDLAILELLLQKKCSYIGTLGPKKRLERMLADLGKKGLPLTNEQRTMLHGPTGLDIGAEAAEEIALSILAEIKAVLAKRSGASLRERQEAIHGGSLPVMAQQQTGNTP
jgi:xanthine/CO dehydrogenase XdhC/CoxF family maturation factor